MHNYIIICIDERKNKFSFLVDFPLGKNIDKSQIQVCCGKKSPYPIIHHSFATHQAIGPRLKGHEVEGLSHCH